MMEKGGRFSRETRLRLESPLSLESKLCCGVDLKDRRVNELPPAKAKWLLGVADPEGPHRAQNGLWSLSNHGNASQKHCKNYKLENYIGYKEVQLSNASTEEDAKNICWKYFEELIDKEWNNETYSTEVRNGRRAGVVTIER